MTTALAETAATITTTSTTSIVNSISSVFIDTTDSIDKNCQANEVDKTSPIPKNTEEQSSTSVPSIKSSNSVSTTPVASISNSSNSYSLDFLHSVGVQMINGNNNSSLKINICKNMRSSTAYKNDLSLTPSRNPYTFSEVIGGHRMPNRFMVSSGTINGAGQQNNLEHYHHHHIPNRYHHHRHHHHQPKQLTLVQNDLLDDGVVSENCNVIQQCNSMLQNSISSVEKNINNTFENVLCQRSYQNVHHIVPSKGPNQQKNHLNSNYSLQHTKSKQLTTKKSAHAISSASSCSSSSSSSSSASASKSFSQSSSSSHLQEKFSEDETKGGVIIAIEPLSIKSTVPTLSYRIANRSQYNNYFHNQRYNHHQPIQYNVIASSLNSQHQNLNNLTYINTDDSRAQNNVINNTNYLFDINRFTNSNSKVNSATKSVNRFQQHGPQFQNILNSNQLQNYRKKLPELSYTVSPLCINTVPNPVQIRNTYSPQQNKVIHSALTTDIKQNDENSPDETIMQTTVTNTSEYDLDTSIYANHRQIYEHTKPVSFSSSSSASSTSSSIVHENNIVTSVNTETNILNSIDDFSQTFSQPNSQSYQQVAIHHLSITPPQQQDGLSLLSDTHNFINCDLCNIQQLENHIQSQNFYAESNDQGNAAQVANNIDSNMRNFRCPLNNYQGFLYPPTSSHLITTSCESVTSILSPSLTELDSSQINQPQHQYRHLYNNLVPISINDQQFGHIKRSFPQQTLMQQRSSINSSVNANESSNLRSRIRNQNCNFPQIIGTLCHNPSSSLHLFPQHNLICNNNQTHIRPLSLANTAAYDLSTHTPPDRFLARAHLIEAKQTPSKLLNNSKWDNLSQSIWNKFVNSQQTEETFKQKMRLWRYLYIIIKNTYPRYGLYLVGSTISGFGANTSDIDMCLVSRSTSNIDPRMEALFNLTILRDCLSKSGEFEHFNLIEAKVPILRFKDKMHQLEVDLNFNNCVGIKNTHLLYCYSQLDWRLRPLVLITKLWAQYHNINNAKNMTISSYSFALMVIHFLQYAVKPPVLPCLHEMFPDKFPLLRSHDFGYVDMNESIGPYESINTQTLGELFLYFLEYYSGFDYTQFAISVRTGGLIPIHICRQTKSLKNDVHQWKELCIEEPFDLTNTARSVYDVETFDRVKLVFVASWRILRDSLNLNAIFTPLLSHKVEPAENLRSVSSSSTLTTALTSTTSSLDATLTSTVTFLSNSTTEQIDSDNRTQGNKNFVT